MGSISGSVVIDGKPVEYGQIEFVPIADKTLPLVSADVRGGKYSAKVPVGEMQVRLYKMEKIKTNNVYGYKVEGMDIYQNVLPAEYNDLSKMSVKIEKKRQTHDFP